MDISTNLFLVPAFLAFLLAFLAVIKKTVTDVKQYKIGEKKQNGLEILIEVIDRINIFTPKKGSKIYGGYKSFLSYSRLSVKKLFRIKLILFIIAIVFLFLKYYTDVGIYTRDIYNRFDYYSDLLYQYKGEVNDKELALKYEINCLDTALSQISKNELINTSKEELQSRIKLYIKAADESLELPKDTIANKVYYRLHDYYKYREINIFSILLISLLFCFIPEILVYLASFFAKADARKELRFLKKLIIVNGSIKPVDFMELLEMLIEKSKYYKEMLQEIQDANKRNNIDNKTIYMDLIGSTKDLDLKLFYEKLDQANNYDFDQAILNIHNEFKMEKREVARKIKKRIDLINILGIMFFMILIVIMIMYLMIPWMKSYNMSQLM
ncbi:hypothetical protein [Pseudobacteroides cellulosolvens]|uniref:Type II secretion system F domain-containing protein n=1 Tax=Pseudobacteroides cellulosolvens ATCC 35603 = DSM 2933 TaxID=398512 RepID=A0A0L6JLU3_9FIRM|nr:hypothetical protein [Pseudobacteroides cellulosolvens]KNY26728.1 hypothetical protein Bccel_1993 [Pseudobacteroides cellulosolvens ATCC 35603 = DSM 2933]